MPPRIAALFILALLSAGCLSSADPTGGAPAASVAPKRAAPDAANVTATVPVWKTGDAWAITTAGGNAGGGSREHSVLVVTSASSDSYTLSTTSQTLAGFDAQFDISYIGRTRAEDLAGAQHGEPVQFFSFPLTDGKSWSPRWDNKTLTATAKASADGSFAIVAMDGANTYATYDYQPALKWWSHLDFASGYTLKVDRFIENWTGDYRTATAKRILDSSTAIPVATMNAYPFTVDQGQTTVQLSFRGAASAYARAFQIQAPDNTPYQANATPTDAQPTGGGVAFQESLPPLPGTWRIEAPVGHAPGGSFLLSIDEIRVDVHHV